MTIAKENAVSVPQSTWAAFQSGRRRAQFACLVASPIPLLMFATIYVLRGGFPIPVHALLKIVGITLLVVNVAAFAPRKLWWICGPLLSFLALLLITALGLSPLGGNSLLAVSLAIAGGVACAWNLIAVIVRAGLLRAAALIVLGLFLGFYAESMYWRVTSVHDVVYPESIIAGRVAADVAEQAAVVNMISTYHVASTGLDGLVPLRYHNGSLWIAESLRRLCGFRAIDFLAFGYGVLLIPFYVVAFFGCAELLRAVVQKEIDLPPFIFWAAALVAFVGVFPFTDDPMHLNFNETIINSDSFLLAVTLSLLLIAAGVWFYELVRARDFVLTFYQQLTLAIILPTALAVIGWIKISQVYLLLGLLFYLCLRIKWLRAWGGILGAALSVLIFVAMYFGEKGANKSSFAPLNFDRIAPEWVPYFFVVYFAGPWLFLLLWAIFYRVQTVKDLAVAAKAKHTIALEIVFVIVITGFVPYLLINFYSPAWKYFTEFQGVVAGLFVVAFLPQFRWADLRQRVREGSLRLSSALLVGLMVAVAGHLFITTVSSAYRMLKRGCETRAVLSGSPASAWRQQLRQLKARHSVVTSSLAPRVQLAQCLDRLGQQSAEQRRGTALYIPKTNRTYWDMRQLGDGTTPFIAPALAGLPMVEGLPEFEDIGWGEVGWGYPQYKLPTAPEPPTEKLAEAIDKARKNGFQQLLVLRGVTASGCEIQNIELQRLWR